MRADEKLTWNDLINTNYWSLELVQAKIGNETLKIRTSSAIVDTGTSFLLVPTEDFDQITGYFLKQQYLCGMEPRNNLFTCLCGPENYAKYPDLFVQLGEHQYRLPKESYIEQTNGKCYFLIMKMNFPYSDGFWILGDNFL